MANEKRLIDANKAQAVLANMAEHLMEAGNPEMAGAVGYAAEVISKQPTVDAVEVVHGRWVEVRGIPSVNRKDVPVVKCSKCEIYFCDLINNHHHMYHYCPNCGAKMDGDKSE